MSDNASTSRRSTSRAPPRRAGRSSSSTRSPAPCCRAGCCACAATTAQTYQQVSDDHQRRRLERLSRRQTPTVEELNAEALELAASLVAGWEDKFDLDGAPLPYSGANAARLLRRFGWIRQQVEQFAGDRANFLPGSTSS
jgi:hypothetical protein